MHLKKLEIQGFKSFPEYTLIEFDQGMTAVVGPNGSGKSNVTDAVRWVLGEQSVRSLRGGKMEDVIFNGTQSRKPMNYAEVSMTLDNSDHYLDSEFGEIQVTRRLYRSGESEYQINHVNCRLKDIVALFLDTGLGKDGYSIVGQGRVDDILSTKSEDRRRVLEEASGIVKYKVRKEEAERKLSSTETNLIRIDDILNELSGRIEPLKEDAEKALRYHKLYEELKGKDIALLCHKISQASEAMGDSADVKVALEQDLVKNEDRYVALRESNVKLKEQAEAIEDKIEDARQALSDTSEEYHEASSDQKLANERKNQLLAGIKNSEGEEQRLLTEIERLNKEYQEKLKKADALLEKANVEKKNTESLVAKKQAVISEYEQSEQKGSGLKKQVTDKTNELIDAREQLKVLDARIQGSDERIASLASQRKISSQISVEIKEHLDKTDALWHEMMQKEAEVTADIAVREEKISELNGQQKKLLSDYETKTTSSLSMNSRLKTLIELEKRKEGYQESVKNLLNYVNDKSSLSSKIIGVLGDLVSTDSKYELAIEIALANSIHNVVTKSESDAAELIGVLKDNRLGRVTFLPIDNIKSRMLDNDTYNKAKRQSGFIGIASDLVKNDSKLDDIVKNLLGRIIIVEDISDARRIASDIKHSAKVISLEGDCINPGGSLTGGSTRRGSVGIIGRSREIEDLKKKTEELTREISVFEAEKQQLNEKISDVSRELAALNEQMNYFTVERVKAETEFNNLKLRLEETQESIKQLDIQVEQTSKEKLKLSDDSEELSLVISETEDELEDYRDSIEENGSIGKEFTDRIEDIKNQITQSTVQVERILAERNGVLQLTEVLQREKSGHEENLKNHTDNRSNDENSVKEIEAQIVAIDALLVELAGKTEVQKQDVNKLIAQKDEIDEELSGFVSKLTDCNDTVNSIRNKLNTLVSKYERYIDDIDSSKGRLWEEYEVTFDNVKEQYQLAEDVPTVQKSISTLKSEIKGIGPVNLNAIDEYKEVSERFEFMSAQRDDIYKAKENLEQVISELVEEMRQQFIVHFNIINENFKTVFSDLFNGGTAEIILENEDVLNCAIEIKAQPPGKKLQSLTLLSGGERCLTAIALLFAILQLRPSPFVILDEVEAALDDVNVSRFTDFVRRYTTKSQFILVTHRKGTMEACDRMYGVTMQERGISKILSMRLGDL